MKRSFASITAAVFVAFAASASAQSVSTGERQVTVSYGDLNVDHEAGAQILINRLRAAADRVCGGRPDIRILNQLGAYQTCVTQAMDRAVASIGHPVVGNAYSLSKVDTSRFQRRFPHSLPNSSAGIREVGPSTRAEGNFEAQRERY